MVVLDSDKNGGAIIGKLLGGLFLVPWVAMLAAGAIASHHEPTLNWVYQFGYWDWVLANFVLALVRGTRNSKWYLKTEKK